MSTKFLSKKNKKKISKFLKQPSFTYAVGALGGMALYKGLTSFSARVPQWRSSAPDEISSATRSNQDITADSVEFN